MNDGTDLGGHVAAQESLAAAIIEAGQFETKSAEPPKPAPQVADDPLVAEVQKTFGEFKTTLDQLHGEVTKGRGPDPVLEEKLKRIDDGLNAISAEMKQRKIEAERPAILSPDAQERADAEFKAFEGALRGRRSEMGQPGLAVTQADYAAYKSAFFRYAAVGERGITAEEMKTLGIGFDPAGGALLAPPTIDATIDRVMAKISGMRSIARVVQGGTQSFVKLVNLSGLSAGWAGETEARPVTNTPSIDRIELFAYELYAQPDATQQMLEDAAFDLEGWLATEVSIVFGEQEGDAFINGASLKRPSGLLSYPTVANSSYGTGATNWGKIGYVPSGVSGGFTAFALGTSQADKLQDLIGGLRRMYRSEGKFLMNDNTLFKVRQLKDGDGASIWKPAMAADMPDGQVLGYPVTIDENMPDIAANSFSIAFGAFGRGYTIYDRRGITILRDPYTNKPYVRFYTTKRVGGAVTNFEAIKLFKFGTS